MSTGQGPPFFAIAYGAIAAGVSRVAALVLYSSFSRMRCALMARSGDMLHRAPQEGHGIGELNLILRNSTGKSFPHSGQQTFAVKLFILRFLLEDILSLS